MEGEGPRGRGSVCSELGNLGGGGEGATFFFSGPNCPPRRVPSLLRKKVGSWKVSSRFLEGFFFLFTPDIPQSGIAATILMTLGRKSGRRIGRNIGRPCLGIFVLHVRCRISPRISPKIPPNVSLHVSSRRLWLKYQNFISQFLNLLNIGKPFVENTFSHPLPQPL